MALLDALAGLITGTPPQNPPQPQRPGPGEERLLNILKAEVKSDEDAGKLAGFLEQISKGKG